MTILTLGTQPSHIIQQTSINKEVPDLASYQIAGADLICIITALGYNQNTVKKGICHGLTEMGSRAFFMGEKGIEAYNSRLKNLTELFVQSNKDAATVAYKINSIVKKIQRKEVVDPIEKLDVIDYFAFFDGIVLHHKPGNYVDLFEEQDIPAHQRLKVLSSMLAPDFARETASVATFSGFYSFNELVSYLAQLRTIFDKAISRGTAKVRFGDTNHTTTVGYDCEKKSWFRIDPWDPLIVKIKTDVEVADLLKIAFQTETFVLKSQIFTFKEHLSPLKELITHHSDSCRFNGLHKITSKKAEFISHGKGHSWLHMASFNEPAKKVLGLLKAGAEVNQITINGFTPLLIAIEYNHIGVVETLLKARADVNQVDANGFTPLSVAIDCGHTEVVKALLKAGANANRVDPNGFTPLFIAAQKGHTEIVNLLLNHKVKVRRVNKNKRSALWIAAQEGHTEVAEALLKAGANVNQADKIKITPLWKAAQKGHIEIAKALLKSGADPTFICGSYGSSINVAKKFNHRSIVKLFKNHMKAIENLCL